MTTIFTTPNDRIFYACMGVFYVERQTTQTGGNSSYTAAASSNFLTGVQSVGVQSSFPWESMPDIGRSQRRFAKYGQQEFTINIERILADDETFFYNVTSRVAAGGTKLAMYKNTHILEEDNIGCDGFANKLRNYDINLLYAPDRFDRLGDSTSGSDPDKNNFMITQYRCCLLTSVSYSIPIKGPVTETLTFTTQIANQVDASPSDWSDMGNSGADRTGNTIKRHDIDTTNSIFPLEVNRMFDLGTATGGIPILGLQSIEIQADISYSKIMDVGQWRGSNLTGAAVSDAPESEPAGSTALRAQQNLYRQVVLPIDVTTTFTGIARSQYRGQPAGTVTFDDPPSRPTKYQDFELTDTTFSAADGLETTAAEPSRAVDARPAARYEADRQIVIVANKTQYFHWNLGRSNYLEDMSFSGGDTGGSNVTASLSYKNAVSDFALYKHNSLTTDTIDPGRKIF